MKTKKFQIVFNTPAFLGDAHQSGRWRSPPFKAQLRQWWRVAFTAQQQFAVNVREMRDVEGHLFGHAWLENDRDDEGRKVAARRSEVRIRLSRWDEGQLRSWERLEAGTVFHREAEKVRNQVGPHAYLGYGPLDGRGGTKLQDKQGKANAAIQANEQAELSIAFPDDQAELLNQALDLMHLYGTVGGRSRNGWGSFSLKRIDGIDTPTSPIPTQALAKCLSVDWPHALGADSHGALVWQTLAHKDWTGLMRSLAEIKIALRTHQPLFSFELDTAAGDRQTRNGNGIDHGKPQNRHWLSYPVTNHTVTSWGNNARLPNSLRFKVRHTDDGLVGVIFHMPHLPPADFRPNLPTLERIWRQVHTHLDQVDQLDRFPA